VRVYFQPLAMARSVLGLGPVLRRPSHLVAALIVAACASPEPAGFDLDAPPVDGPFDWPVCAPYPGGSLLGDDLLVLVNKEADRQLAAQWEPGDLVPIPTTLMMPERTGLLRRATRDALVALAEAASEEDGLELVARSAYRSFETQCWTFDHKVKTHGLAHAKRFSAEPGRSQHQLGTTVDITSATLGFALEQTMGERAEGLWLANNAHRFGFALSYPRGAESITGYAFEPWHYRYIGIDAAFEMHEQQMLLEEYLLACEAGDTRLTCPREEPPSPVPNEGFIGGACQKDDDCVDLGPTARCLTEDAGYPGGHCTRECTTSCPDRAGANAVTACLSSEEGNLCHSRCDFDLLPDNGCRDSYQCRSSPRPQGDSVPACVPR